MSLATRLVATWMATGSGEDLEATIREVSHNQVTLLDLVKALGEYLTSDNEELRTKGVDFLSSVLRRTPTEKLNQQSVRVLVTFYCGKLEDFETRVSALNGLHTLTRLSTFSPTDVESVTRAIFSNVTMKALIASVRFIVFSILDSFMSQHRRALKALGRDFIARYICLVDGEKDPRNLLVSFAITRVILIEFDTSDHVESLFNITFAYFPITFRPPADEPYGITPDDLRSSLRACLSALPQFGPLALPLFLDKLMAGSPVTKQDTLQTMAICFPVYGSAFVRANAQKLWNSLKLEIFHSTDLQTENDALKAVQALVETIYAYDQETIGSDDGTEGLVVNVCDECVRILREPEKSLAKPAIRILCAFVATTPAVSKFTLSRAVPHLIQLFSNPDEILNRESILLLLADLVNATRHLAKQDSGDTKAIPLMTYKDEVIGAVSTGLKSATARYPALAIIQGLIGVQNLLTNEEIGFLVHLVNELFTSEEMECDDLCDTATLNILTTIAQSAHFHVREQTLPLLFAALPDNAPPRGDINGRARYWRVLLALGTLCVHHELFETLVVRIITKIDLIYTSAMAKEDTESDAAYIFALLITLRDTLHKKVDASHTDVAKYIEELVPRIFNIFIHSTLRPEQEWLAGNSRIVEVGADIIKLICQCLSVEQQDVFVKMIFKVLESGDVQGIIKGFHKIEPTIMLNIFSDKATLIQKNLLALFAAGIIPSYKEVRPPIASLGNFLDDILSWGIRHAENQLQCDAAWHLISSMANKRAEDVEDFFNDKINSFCPHHIFNTGATVEERRRAILAWAWMSKALLMRGHPLAFRFIDCLFEILGDIDVNLGAAKAFGSIGSQDLVLTKTNHAVIKILHVQKFVNRVLPLVVAGVKDSAKGAQEQAGYIVALTALVKAVPKTTYAHELPALMPLLLYGLELPDANLRADVIDTLLAGAEGATVDQSLISEHASSLVKYMLRNCLSLEMPIARARIAALRYLGVLPAIVRYDVLHASKPVVLREVAKALDDPKKSVRRVAVDARSIWYEENGYTDITLVLTDL